MDTIPPYEFKRSDGPPPGKAPSSVADSMDYSEPVDEQSSYGVDSYVAASSILTASPYPYPDATQTVHEMHLALLYLLSNPDEFQKALTDRPPRGATTLAQWNQEYDEQGSVNTNGDTISTFGNNTVGGSPGSTPLPFVVFADDAEVVLPQAHTASQLFGVERLEGIELEAAAGVPAISQLFLMPGGDHLNIIDPPGLTVMRIAGGRYRVTAAHRVVWTWMNEFAQIEESENQLQVDDLVTMTIVDVFETDNNGRLLSYCPTFDNREVCKTTQAAETIRKSSTKIMSQWSVISKSQAASRFNEGLTAAAKMGLSAAKSMANQVKNAVDERMTSSPQRTTTSPSPASGKKQMDARGFEMALNEATEAAAAAGTTTSAPSSANYGNHGNDIAGGDPSLNSLQLRSDTYVSEGSGDNI